MTHLTREELQRWWRDGAPGERDRILAHLAECDECGALYGEVIDADPVQPDAAAVRVAAPRGYRVFRRSRRMFGVDWSTPRVLAVCGAAAVVVLAAIVPTLLRPSGPEPDGGGIRGTSLQPLAPIGAVTQPVQFRWTSPVNAARYVVEVREDGGEQILFSLTSEAESVDLPQEQLGRLTPGRAYSWVVVAADQAGAEIMRAPPRSFVVAAVGR
jgi:hypothetical protein